MAENGGEFLPIKVVTPTDSDFRPPEPGGSGRKVFGEVTDELRQALASKLDDVEQHFESSFHTNPDLPGVARVKLKDEALAKSHRPNGLFDKSGCRVIGTRRFGEMLVSVTPSSISSLRRNIERDQTQQGTANVSTIDEISAYSAMEALPIGGAKALFDLLRERPEIPNLKLKLFRHPSTDVNSALRKALDEQLGNLKITATPLRYAREMTVLRLESQHVSEGQIESIARFVGTQSLGVFPELHLVRTQVLSAGQYEAGDFPNPSVEGQYPVLGVFDSGIQPGHPVLEPWVLDRDHQLVPASEREFSHGTFVGGLAVHPRTLNHGDERFPSGQVKLVDVAAFPGTGYLSEDQVLVAVEHALRTYRDVRVWNLSVNSGLAVSDHKFSDFAIALDALQDEYNVTFVITAGNFLPPLRSWPPSDNPDDRDRLAEPADSVRGVVVSALAHTDTASTVVRADEPAPYSRRGPGAANLPKPDVAHYGGNCTHTGAHAQTGVLSFDPAEGLVESVGTSYAAPLCATTLASIHDAAVDGLSRPLAKALLIHAARLGVGGRIEANSLRYRGFGTPPDVAQVLSCRPHQATLVFEFPLWGTHFFEKRSFPIPPSLRSNGRVRGEFTMTLVYDPPLDAAFGAEYVRSNVDVSLGTYRVDENGKAKHHGQIPPEPQALEKMYEKALVEHGFKWSPVKSYYRLIPQGVAGDEWRLVVKLTDRKEHNRKPGEDQSIALLVTIGDPKKQAPVYNEVIQQMARLGWIIDDLRIRANVRQRVRGTAS